ncbi:MAG TPA: glycoside hydrolase family 3 N-terminal domain-containing protein [Opitutaceae bacterium]|nr:glycoside hydrolase family 3 N-terminal domain-containing protein [Opitutaceae bacterium]
MDTPGSLGLLPLDEAGARWVDARLGALTPEQKIGQLMVFPHYGAFITPDVVDLVERYHVGGLRIAQKFAPGTADHRGVGANADPERLPDADTWDRPENLDRIACTAREFAATLNELRERALARPGGVPLHTAFDQEGEGADLLFEQRLFPHPMGQAASGDPHLAFRIARAIGRQAHAVGANMIHSPVVDVNTEPLNPEIGPRAYGDTAATVTPFALAALRGFASAGIAATAKHFPGRGPSRSDAHFGLPEIALSRAELLEQHIAPYRALIEAGLPCVMAAFTSYPALGAANVPAATSRAVVTDLLRGELGFEGVVTTDNIQMGGLLARYGMGEAVVRCLVAGCDLVLCRAYSPQRRRVLEAVREAVRSGRFAERDLDAAVRRVLTLRWKMGLAATGGLVDADRAGSLFHDPEIVDLADEAATRGTVLLRDRTGMLPLPRDRRILLVEQVHHFHRFINNGYAHPGVLWRELRGQAPNIATVAVNETVTDSDREAIRRRVAEADIIVVTSYYNYRSHALMLPVLEELRAAGRPLVVVSNTPYEAFGVPAWVDTAVVSFCPSGRENIRAVAEILLGRREATARLPVTRL